MFEDISLYCMLAMVFWKKLREIAQFCGSLVLSNAMKDMLAWLRKAIYWPLAMDIPIDMRTILDIRAILEMME